MRVSQYVHWNRRDVPVQKEGESAQDFESRMELFRKTDLRVPVAGFGKPNFGFGRSFIIGMGTLCDKIDRPTEKWAQNGDGLYVGTGEYTHQKTQKGDWAVPQES